MLLLKGLVYHLTSYFDMLQVEWELYGGEDALPFQLSNVCGANDDFYRMRCSLIYFYAVEFHLPDRVGCQFGVRQLWPTALFLTSVDLHK